MPIYPMQTIAVDFETYYSSDYSIKDLGNYAYTHHPEFDAYLVALCNGPQTHTLAPHAFDWASIAGPEFVWVSHNMSFDRAVYTRLVEMGVVADVWPEAWYCTADMASYLGYPRSFQAACRHLLGIDIPKDTRDKLKGRGVKAMQQDPEFWQEVVEYATRDAIYCWQLWDRFSFKWPQWERDLSVETARMGYEGIPINRSRLQQAKGVLANQRMGCLQAIPWSEGSDKKTPLSAAKFAALCRTQNTSPPKSRALNDPECDAWLETAPESLSRVLLAQRNFGRINRLSSVLESIEARTSPRTGRLHYSLKYGGAHTMRDSGSGGFNVQNMPRDEMFGVDIRSLFEAPEGFVFIVADSSQIEPRCSAWLKRDAEFMDLLRTGIDCYEAYARRSLGYDDPRPIKEGAPKLRQMAKVQVLSLDYGVGWEKYQITAAKEGVQLSEAEARRAVGLHRSDPKLKAVWRDLTRAMKQSVGGDFELELPSGRVMNYRNIRVTKDGMTAEIADEGRMAQRGFYDGKLYENLVQATARDVFMWQVLQLRALGYPVLLRVHDEIVTVVREELAEAAISDILEIFRTAPPWLAGCPLDAQAHVAANYSKA